VKLSNPERIPRDYRLPASPYGTPLGQSLTPSAWTHGGRGCRLLCGGVVSRPPWAKDQVLLAATTHRLQCNGSTAPPRDSSGREPRRCRLERRGLRICVDSYVKEEEKSYTLTTGIETRNGNFRPCSSFREGVTRAVVALTHLYNTHEGPNLPVPGSQFEPNLIT